MLSKILITLCVLLYAVGSPMIEVNATHVFNPDWTPHVRIHEVWQLITNSCLGVIALWLVWIEKRVIFGALLSITVMASFLVAYALRGFYGGAMQFANGSENMLFGINFGLFVATTVVGILVLAIYLEWRRVK